MLGIDQDHGNLEIAHGQKTIMAKKYQWPLIPLNFRHGQNRHFEVKFCGKHLVFPWLGKFRFFQGHGLIFLLGRWPNGEKSWSSCAP